MAKNTTLEFESDNRILFMCVNDGEAEDIDGNEYGSHFLNWKQDPIAFATALEETAAWLRSVSGTCDQVVVDID